MLVEVRPIESPKWHGKTKGESFKRPLKLSALVDGETMRYATGLSKEDIEKLKKKGVSYNLSDEYDPDKPHEFWDSPLPVVKLENNTQFFNTDNVIDFIKVK
ncbi:MAG: hypothetical protein KDD58_16010, partial [Bdellovibrionales bacterium]|nr:hypothetical protein [Bdellovibrionales bacterium]